MLKQRKTVGQNAENVVNYLLALCVIALAVFSLYSGGELLGLLLVLVVLAMSYRIVRYSFSEIHLEKLFFITVGLYFTSISLIGFTLVFFGLGLSVKNFLVFSIITLMAVLYLTAEKKPCKVNIDKKRLLLVAGSFVIAFLVYMWPAMPSFTSPCTCGFDCTLHIEYSATIHTMEAVAPPVREWRFYPAGFHINTAMLAHALEPDMPANSNLIYPLIAFISALMVGMLSGMLYDRLKNKLYILLFLIAMLTATYPVSALIGFGFWAHLFGIYYAILFAYNLSDFVENPKNWAIISILLLTLMGSILAYQILTSLTIIFAFIIASLTLTKLKLAEKVKITLTFLIIFSIFYSLYLLEEYSKFLGYSFDKIDTHQYFGVLAPEKVGLFDIGRIDISLDGTMFRVRGTGIHVEDVFVVPGVKLSRLLSEGLKVGNIKNFLALGDENVNGPSGAVLGFDLKWFGLLTLFLMLTGLLYSYSNREYTLVFMEASILHLFIFSYAMHMGRVNWYYYSKMMYMFIYPVTLYAIVGIEELLSRLTPTKKRLMAVGVIMLLMVSYSLNLLTKENVIVLIGQRNDIYEQPGLYWPLLEFNRFQRYWDLAWGNKRDSYGLGEWLRQANITTGKAEESAEPPTTSGVWMAADDFPQHEVGSALPDGSWMSERGSFGYLIGRNYMNIPPGTYDVTFTLKASDNSKGDEAACFIEVAKDHGAGKVAGKLISSKDFSANDTYQNFTLSLDLKEAIQDLEFRAHYDRYNLDVTLLKVTLSKK
ncbi:MAG: hypothetical protein FJY77_03030 [Candidatus Altiarchaeales archaeon]|nr:hypothetical protein [Candidatus Altiarchaeales archaeon]